MKGPPDGVAADIQCAVTQFAPGENGGERTISGQATMPCTVYCSYKDGTVGVSIRGIDLQIDLLVTEVMAIMQAGAEANQEHTGQGKTYTDAELEDKWVELQGVGWDEADSPSGLILSAPWWVFPRGVDRGDLFTWFDTLHSAGIEYLMTLPRTTCTVLHHYTNKDIARIIADFDREWLAARQAKGDTVPK
jgi:hypothetical protein